MPQKKATKNNLRMGLPLGAVIYGALTVKATGGVNSIAIHGAGGPGTSLLAKKNGVDYFLPSGSIVGVSPGIHYVAWDGNNYVIRPTLENIHEYDHLTLIGHVEVPYPTRSEAGFRPPIDPLVAESIEQLLHQMDKRYWPTIAEMRVKKFYPPYEPVPPAAKLQLLSRINTYASMSFKTEADQYASFKTDGRYPAWLDRLKDRIIRRVLDALDRLDGSDQDSLLLGYHGLQKPEIENNLRQLLWEISRQYETGTTPWEIQAFASAPQSLSLTGEQARAYALAGIDIASPSPLLQVALSDRERTTTQPQGISQESLANQLKRLRAEADITGEIMAEALSVDIRQIRRHFAGQTKPRTKHIEAYEKLFSDRLGRSVALKRHP